ncbi:MAG TPA: NAD(P)/FAD-dependent oxidoreductase [Streptosporangiaceae bacterium]
MTENGAGNRDGAPGRTALVIGAGVAGSVAAIALIEAGWRVQVFEAYQRSAGLAQGAFLTMAVNGLDALRAVRADHVVRDLGFRTGQIRFLSGRGRELGAMAIGPVLPDGTTTRTLLRTELYAALSGLAAERGAEFRYGLRLTGAREVGGQVQATFADGTAEETAASGDVLIGADGVRSVVRTLIGPDAPGPDYTGMGNVGAVTAPGPLDVRAEAADGDYRMIWGKHCFFGYTVSPDQQIWWFANPPSRRERTADELRATGPDELRAELIRLLAADRGPAAEIVRATRGPILISNQYQMPRVPNWHHGRMVIIGDAAHAVSPSTGQGVSLAAEDAVALARQLRDADQVPAALARYQAERRDRVDQIAAWGASMGGTKTPGATGRVLRDLMLPRILAKGSTPEAMARQDWLFGYHIDWPATVA